MTRFGQSIALGAFGLVFSIGSSGAASAADFAQTTAAQEFSLTHGLAQTTLATQQRVAPATASRVTATLLAGLCGRGCALQSMSPRANGLHSSGTGWTLAVSADGSAARFENVALASRTMSLAKDPSQKMSAAMLESAGRAVIAASLRSAIVLGPREELVPVRTAYLMAGMQNIKTHTIVNSVIANRIVFGRRLAGVPIVGGGSTVVLTFANNGALQSLRYDWPRYQPAAVQAIANVSQIVGRVNRVIGARQSTGRSPQNASRISVKMQANARVDRSSIALQKLECGYFDPGVAARTAGSLVQPGCVYHIVERDGVGFRQGFAGAVPAGVAFNSDAGWAETKVLRSGP